VGPVITDIRSSILIVAPEGREEEAVMRLSRVGYDHAAGFLQGGMDAWVAAGLQAKKVTSVSAQEFVQARGAGVTLDVRKPSEYESAHLKTARSAPLDFIHSWVETLDKKQPYVLHCAGGYRSMIAASILQANGISNVTDVRGGFSEISKVPEAGPSIVRGPVLA
jgi:hydroxyacylglutathione hydrolase